LARVLRVLVLVGLVFAALPVGSALANTTVGQTGTPLTAPVWAGGFEEIQNSAAMPAAGIVTSFQTQSGSCVAFTGGFDFQVLHPLGGNQYKVLGDTGNQTNPCDGQFHSYPPLGGPVAVHAGDVLGVDVPGDLTTSWEGVLSVTSGSRSFAHISEPAVGHIITVLGPFTGTIDESATLMTRPTSNDQCKNGGWKNFGTTFKNQGDCVSFVATGAKNPPSGA
jgi:hypothetical protein